jgi:hypothetical protein
MFQTTCFPFIFQIRISFFFLNSLSEKKRVRKANRIQIKQLNIK